MIRRAPPRALPDPEHPDSHHEQDEATLLVRSQLSSGDLATLGDAKGMRRAAGSFGNGGSGAGSKDGTHLIVVADIADGGTMGEDPDDAKRAVAPPRAAWWGGLLSPAGKLQVMGLDVTPELCAIALVYFVQGILGLSRLALSFYFKDDLHVEPAQVAVLTGLAMTPWVIKPVYGFISDSIPLFGYRRRSYLALCGLMGAASWLALATIVNSPGGAVAAMMLGALSTAASDVVVDSIVVARARGAEEGTTGSLQSVCWAAQSMGGIASAYFSGSLVQSWGVHPVFLVTGMFPLFVSVSALLIDEQRVTLAPSPSPSPSAPDPALGGPSHALPAAHGDAGGGGGLAPGGLGGRLLSQGASLWGAVKRKDILLPTAFVFLWQATPSADSAMFYFYTNHLHFEPEFLGRVRLAGCVASLVGVGLYNGFFKKVPLKRMFFWAMIIGTVLGSTQLLLVSGANRALGLSDRLFVLGDSVILTVLGQVSFMPVLVLAARLCPEGVEATLFATLMSIMNGGAFIGSALGAGLTSLLGVTGDDFSNLFALTAICVGSTLLPMPFLSLLPSSVDLDESSPGAGVTGGTSDAKGRPKGSDAGDAEDEEAVALLDLGEMRQRRDWEEQQQQQQQQKHLPLVRGRRSSDGGGDGRGAGLR